VLFLVETNMQTQVRFEYNNTALPRNVTNSSVMRTTAFWDAMQIKVRLNYMCIECSLWRETRRKATERHLPYEIVQCYTCHPTQANDAPRLNCRMSNW